VGARALGDPPDAIPVADDEATAGASDQKDDGDGADGNGAGAGLDPHAENASRPVATEDSPAEAEEIEEGTRLFTVPFVIPHGVLLLLRSVYASAHGTLAGSPDVPGHTPKFCAPDAHDYTVHGTHTPPALLMNNYDTRRHQTYRV